jgi:hypothetical protein
VGVDISLKATQVLYRTHLVMMWCTNEDNWALPGDVESTSRTNLPEEDACNGAPEEEGGLVGELGRKRERFHLFRHAGGPRTVMKVKR